MNIKIVRVDYQNPDHARDLITLLDLYASGLTGGESPLSAETKENLCPRLAQLPYAFSLLLYCDGIPAALANCLDSFSTFTAQGVVNIHDFVVAPQFRGQQLSQKLLEAIETVAHEKQCCKITLEVLEGNSVAIHAYRKFGFQNYELDPAMGKALFLEKKLL